MSKFKTAIKLIINDRGRFLASLLMLFGTWMSDKYYLKFLYRFLMRENLDLNCPKTFTEKIQWLKLYNRKPEFTKMVDKVSVKDYVASKIGSNSIIPTLGIWKKFEDIDFKSLPSQFVLKTSHGGGGTGVVICRDKETFDKKKAEMLLKKSMEVDIYRENREWPYKNVNKCILAEALMVSKTDPSSDLFDYKFYCFNGEPRYCQVIRDRRGIETIDFYDMKWNHQEFVGLNPIATNGITPVDRPKCLDGMIDICKTLAKDISFIRVDLYVIDDLIYFGELTFFPASGFGRFSPSEWNLRLGELLKLPSIVVP